MNLPKINEQYKHIKSGRSYTVIEIAKHTENLVPLVIYKENEASEVTWARPVHMFMDGRFEKINRKA